jgi:hypothetical protein
VHSDVVFGAAVLGDCQGDPLLGLLVQGAAPQLGAHACVGTKRGGRARQHADEVVELAAAGQGALEDVGAALGRGQLVVDVKPADLHVFTPDHFLSKMHPTNKNASTLRVVSVRDQGAVLKALGEIRPRRPRSSAPGLLAWFQPERPASAGRSLYVWLLAG